MAFSLRSVTPGCTIGRTYFAVPDAYTSGPEFDTWQDAVEFAQKRRADVIASLTETLAGYDTPEGIAGCADTQIRIDLRWTIYTPAGGIFDTVIESYPNVSELDVQW